MPHSSHTQQTKTHKAAAGYSPRLCNKVLLNLVERTAQELLAQ